MDGAQSGFRLERGATGFFGEVPVPDVDPRVCRSAWHAAARAASGRIGDFVEREYPRNFHSATIRGRDGSHVALFHAHHPLIAFVDERRPSYACTDQFRSPPAWAVVLGGFGFTVLSAAVLRSPLSAVDTSALSTAERREIAYWRPETVGAVLFNSWD